jgi:menaquinone-dependent protoporphyrinogen oxidase
VIGSAVYFGAWRKDATAFVAEHKDVLSQSPLWLFSSGPVGGKDLPDPKEIAGFVHDLSPRGHRVFAGRLDRASLSIGERLAVRGVKAAYGDFRDWAAIDSWAKSIAAGLVPEAATTTRAVGRATEG